MPTRATQSIQTAIQDRVLATCLSATVKLRPPLVLHLLTSVPGLRRLPSRILGLNVPPEHISPELIGLMKR